MVKELGSSVENRSLFVVVVVVILLFLLLLVVFGTVFDLVESVAAFNSRTVHHYVLALQCSWWT